MLYGGFIVLISFIISVIVINRYFPSSKPGTARDNAFLKKLYFYHLFLSLVYYVYAIYSPSDSSQYYKKVAEFFRGESWSDFYGTSTTFIEWIGYPFVHYFGFTYEAMMAMFSLFGFLGFIHFYKVFREQIYFKHQLLGIDLILLFFLLPNLHFWSASFGKGSLIFLGISLIFYGFSNIQKRWIVLFVGSVLTYHIRPHIMFVILASTLIGFTFSSKGLGVGVKVLVIVLAAGAFFYIYKDVLTMVGIEQGEELTNGLDLDQRAKKVSYATSGVDITGYPLPLQVFTFLFRPLFFDAPGVLGLIVSVENVVLLFLTLSFLFKGGIGYLFRGDFIVKTAFLSFITVSIALAQISGNLGIAIRQKSQVMMLFLLVIIKLLDERKIIEYRRMQQVRRRQQEANALKKMAKEG